MEKFHVAEMVFTKTQFFDEPGADGKRRKIDFILAYTPISGGDDNNRENEKNWSTQRSYFIQQLAKKGIESESTTVYQPDENGKTKTVFIKLHGTLPFLYNYCNMNMFHYGIQLRKSILINGQSTILLTSRFVAMRQTT